jgi:uncharacterized protein (TIGR02246 family)
MKPGTKSFAATLGLLATTLFCGAAEAQVIPIHGGNARQEQMLYAAETLQEYQNIIRDWTAAWGRGSARDVARLYLEDATLVPEGGVILRGRREIVPALDPLLASRRNVRINLVEYEVRGTLFYALGSYTHSEVVDGNGNNRNVTGMVVTILQRDGRSWRIRSQIFSPSARD